MGYASSSVLYIKQHVRAIMPSATKRRQCSDNWVIKTAVRSTGFPNKQVPPHPVNFQAQMGRKTVKCETNKDQRDCMRVPSPIHYAWKRPS